MEIVEIPRFGESEVFNETSFDERIVLIDESFGSIVKRNQEASEIVNSHVRVDDIR